MKRRIILAAAVAALALALLVWRRPPQAPPERAERSRRLPAPKLREAREQAPTPSSPTARAPVRVLRSEARADDGALRGAFAGTVLDSSTGAPVAGAELTFEGALGVESATSDASGRFRFEPSDGGDYRLAAALKEGYLPYAPTLGESPIALRPRPRQIVDGLFVYLQPARDLRGRVVDASGERVAEAEVKVLGASADAANLAPASPEYRSDAIGEFVFQAAIGTVLEARDRHGQRGRATLDDDAQRKGELVVTLAAAAPTAVVGGRVVDGDGAPIADAEIVTGGDDASSVFARGRSDEEGRFALEVHAERDVSLRVRADGYAPAVVPARGGAGDVVVVLGPDARITGRVVDESGAPLPSFHVAVLEPQGPMFLAMVAHQSVFSADGRFEVRGLSPGSYQVVATAYAMAPSSPRPATAGVNPSPVTLTLASGTTVHGTVRSSANRRPLARAQVSMESSLGGRGTSALPLIATAFTDDAGRFELAGLLPGRVSLVAEATGHHSRIVGGLDASSGPRIGPIDIELSAIAPGDVAHVELAGIGAVIAGAEMGLRIDRILPGSGAERAGLGVGDVIVTIDGARALELGFEASLQRLRGPVGSLVELGVVGSDGQARAHRVPRLAIRF